MTANPDPLRSVTAGLSASAHALSALCLALDARVHGAALPPALAPYVDDVLRALGVAEHVQTAPSEDVRAILGELQTSALLNAALVARRATSAAWDHEDAQLLSAAGEASTGFARRFRELIAPQLPGIAERLAHASASFLDVGVGVAALSIEMARLWPALSVVGIDVSMPALVIAHERVLAAGLTQRITLSELRAELLDERERFDLAWVPSLFVCERVIAQVLDRVHGSLKPGGWLLLPCTRATGDDLASASMRLRTALFGGLVWPMESVHGLLRATGFIDVRTLDGPAGATVQMAVARRSGQPRDAS